MTAATQGVIRGLQRRIEWFVIGALVIVGALATWFRVPWGHQDRVWAEDGTEFLLDQVSGDGWSSLFLGYTGYQHFLPRILTAAITSAIDMRWYAIAVFAVCSLVVGAVAAGVFVLARSVVPWMPARIALASITFLIPLASQEVSGNLADLHTYMMWLAPWLLFYVPRSWFVSVICGILAFIVVATEIQAVFFVFLLLFRLAPRYARSWPIFGGLAAGAILQVVTVFTSERHSAEGTLSVPSLVLGWLINSAGTVVVTDPDRMKALLATSGVMVAFVVLVPVLVAGIYALVRGGVPQRVMVIALALGSAAVYAGSALANSADWFRYFEVGLTNSDALLVGSRYGVASGMFLLAIIPIGIGVLFERLTLEWPERRGRAQAWAGGLSAILVVALVALGNPSISMRGDAERWSGAVDAAAVACEEGRADGGIALPVAPFREVVLTCEQLGLTAD